MTGDAVMLVLHSSFNAAVMCVCGLDSFLTGLGAKTAPPVAPSGPVAPVAPVAPSNPSGPSCTTVYEDECSQVN